MNKSVRYDVKYPNSKYILKIIITSYLFKKYTFNKCVTCTFFILSKNQSISI